MFEGGGEMGALMRSIDWAATPLGPPEQWSPALRTMVNVLLANRFPMLLWWGPQFIQLYNDAYRPVLGTKHPGSIGQPGAECWPEIWHVIGPLAERPFRGGPPTWMEDLFLEPNRHGFIEETHFTVAYSPVPDETVTGGIGGVLATVHETTQKVIGERRMVLLRELGTGPVVESQSAEAACAAAAVLLAQHDRDLPFALLYLIAADRKRADLAGSAGVRPGQPISPTAISLEPIAPHDKGWPLRDLLHRGTLEVIERLASRFEHIPPGPWSDPPHTAVVVPIPSNISHQPAGIFIAGVSPRLALDEQYIAFVEVLTTQIGTAIASARAYAEERRRAETLAELDRAKTRFFSNVSHEFRTPLTLMLGPTADLLGDSAIVPADRQRLEVVHRNALRLQKLVNSMLDFSRIEAGRMEAVYEPTDLGPYTAELASAFRAATDRAGLALVVEALPLPEPVYVDRDMWEKVVLNLVSNAFKHTFEGSIAVRIRGGREAAIVEVSDTGVGIAAEDLPRVFERFYRVPNVRSRTHEGTGIGLALVNELVRQHGGRIEVASRAGQGTTFRVTLPYGTAHLPPSRVRRSEANNSSEAGMMHGGAMPYVQEALGWLPDADALNGTGVDTATHATQHSTPTGTIAQGAPRILLADDNADMRAYIARLLRGRGWIVEAVSDGNAALAAARARRPDLLLSDVMMPGLDGFELLRALRSEPETATVPVVLVSARAGEEARIEAAEASADDYLVKPFGGQELVARVGAQLSLARARDQLLSAEQAARAAAEASSRAKSDFLAVMSHELRTPLNAIGGHTELLAMGVYGPLNDAQRESISRIERSQQHLSRLIGDLLNLAKVESGQMDYSLETVLLQDVVPEVGTLIETQLASKGIHYHVEMPAEALAVRADREKLTQILLNLLSNALKFTPAGGDVRLTAQTRPGVPNAVFIRVADTGIGIAHDKQEMIFEPFVQLHTGRARRADGAGLGLAISRDLARGMSGDLRVRSAEGEGSVFTLRLERVVLREP